LTPLRFARGVKCSLAALGVAEFNRYVKIKERFPKSPIGGEVFMRPVVILAFLIATFHFSCMECQADPISRQKAIDVFWALEARPWDNQTLGYARAELETAKQRNSNEPWVYIAEAKMVRTAGYKSYQNYTVESGEVALDLAKKAVELDPNHSMAHAYYGLMLYSAGKNELAWKEYQTAMGLDPNNAWPFFYTAEAIADAKDVKQLEIWMAKVEPLAKGQRYQHRLHVLRRRLANLNKDDNAVEASFRADLADQSENPWLHGNFASFLTRKKRYDEAIQYYEKALLIMDYGMAREGLDKARRLKAAAER
jgi:Tfp pilus assembly protein PilF